MALQKFDRNMSCEELCAFLGSSGVEEEDLRKIKEGRYNGRSILLLFSESNVDLYKLKLSDSCNLVLEKLLSKHAPPKDEVDTTITPEKPLVDWALWRDNYAAFGLGHGVDASNPYPMKDQRRIVRIVLPDRSNVQEGIKNEKFNYEDIITSVSSQKSSVVSSVSDLVGKVLTFSAEAEYMREYSKELKAKGEKVITRCVSFKPYCYEEEEQSPAGRNDSPFEEELSSRLVHQLPAIAEHTGNTNADKVQAYLDNNPDEFWQVVAKVHAFIKAEKVTHYVSAIDLGAAAYSIRIMRGRCCKRNAKLEAGVDFLASLGAQACSKLEKKREQFRDASIGQLKRVKCGKGEGVIAYKLLPVFELVCSEHQKIKEALQKATYFYLKRCSGPFAVLCEYNGRNIYWKVDASGDNQVIVGTPEQSQASVFYIEKQCRPHIFNIAYYGEQVENYGSKRTHSKYVTKKVREGEGPLQVQGRNAGYFVLRHPTKKKGELSTEHWETDACNIRLLPRKMQKKRYAAFDGDANKTMYVRSSQNNRGNIMTRFRLFRVGIEHMRCRLESFEYDRTLKRERNPTWVVSDGGEEDACAELGEGLLDFEAWCKEDGARDADLRYEDSNDEGKDSHNEDSSDEDDWLWESDGEDD